MAIRQLHDGTPLKTPTPFPHYVVPDMSYSQY